MAAFVVRFADLVVLSWVFGIFVYKLSIGDISILLMLTGVISRPNSLARFPLERQLSSYILLKLSFQFRIRDEWLLFRRTGVTKGHVSDILFLFLFYLFTFRHR